LNIYYNGEKAILIYSYCIVYGIIIVNRKQKQLTRATKTQNESNRALR